MKKIESHQRGIALLMVLWMTVFMTMIVASLSRNSQIETFLTRNSIDSTQTYQTALAALQLVVYQLKHPDVTQKPWADGRPYRFTLFDSEVTVIIQDEAGKINMHGSDPEAMTRLLQQQGKDEEGAKFIIDALLDYTDKDEEPREFGAEREDYESMGLSSVPRNAPFTTLEELLLVPDIDYDLLQAIAPAVTVYTKEKKADLNVAPEAVLATLPEVSEEFLETYMDERFSVAKEGEALTPLPDGKALKVSKGKGPVYTVLIEIDAQAGNSQSYQWVVSVKKPRGILPYEVLSFAAKN